MSARSRALPNPQLLIATPHGLAANRRDRDTLRLSWDEVMLNLNMAE